METDKEQQISAKFFKMSYFKVVSFRAYFGSHYIQSGDQDWEAVGW